MGKRRAAVGDILARRLDRITGHLTSNIRLSLRSGAKLLQFMALFESVETQKCHGRAADLASPSRDIHLLGFAS